MYNIPIHHLHLQPPPSPSPIVRLAAMCQKRRRLLRRTRRVKSVYAEYLPSSWGEEKVREYFKRFGEIENVVMATDILSSRRKDSAFIHYTNRDAALRCIEVVNREILEDHSSKVKIIVSLANLNPTSNPMGLTPDQTSNQLPIAKPDTIKNTVWSRLGTRGTEQSLSTSEISAKLHDRLAPVPFKSPTSNSDEASPAKISAKLHDQLAPIPFKSPASHSDEASPAKKPKGLSDSTSRASPSDEASPAKISAELHDRRPAHSPLKRSASHSDEASPAKISAKLHDQLAPIPLKRPASHSDETSPAKKPKGLSDSTSRASPSDEASPAKISAELHDRRPAHSPLKRSASHSDEASPATKSAKLHDQLAPVPLKRPDSHLDEASPAKKPKGLSGSTSPPSPTSSPIMTSMLNLTDGKMSSRYIQSLCPSPDRPSLEKMGDTELIDSCCLDQSKKAMAKLAVIVSRSERGFTNPELTNELNSLKKGNAELRSELEKSQTIVLRLMDVADTFRTRAKSQEEEIKNLENENAALRAKMDNLQADCTKRINEARTEGIWTGHQGFPELALINRSGRSQRGLPLVWRNFEPSF
ncbi:hypothetical protein CASFOL_029516 [Castilleja foliolosa]|uniref:RRM domain-containing protein n=1 Tax=Castilleja foliolosa TaxID=1961234 RepID=A0ABD3CB80_9LAMI